MHSVLYCKINFWLCLYTQSAYTRPQPSLDYLHRRRKEIMAQLEERKVVSPPPFASSPNLAHNYDPNYTQEVRGQNHVRSLVICLRETKCDVF